MTSNMLKHYRVRSAAFGRGKTKTMLTVYHLAHSKVLYHKLYGLDLKVRKSVQEFRSDQYR